LCVIFNPRYAALCDLGSFRKLFLSPFFLNGSVFGLSPAAVGKTPVRLKVGGGLWRGRELEAGGLFLQGAQG
jgi:hypothetical protein